jgi:hypothetical protein
MHELTPINVWAGSEEEIGRLMSNLARTPIVIDGLEFGSVEAFITWLVTDPAKLEKREKIRAMWGRRSKTSAPAVWPETISYGGKIIAVGGEAWYELIKRGIRIKMETYHEITAAFLATRPRSITHVIRGEPKSPDFVKMIAQLREEFAARAASVMGEPGGTGKSEALPTTNA